MSRSALIEDFIEKYVVTPGLEFHRPSRFRTHTELITDVAANRGWRIERTGKSLFSFYDGSRLVGVLQQMITSLTGSVAVSICARKNVARQFFAREGVSIAPGASFFEEEEAAAREYFGSVDWPVVVKPGRGSGGKGITTNVQTLDRFDEAWKVAKAAQPSKGAIVVERQVSGIDIRVFVVDGAVVAAGTRIPAFVVGDGHAKLQELIAAKQEERSKSAYYKRMPIIVDWDWIDHIGLTESSVIEEGRVVCLSLTFNIHQGGTNLDLTDRIGLPLKDLACRAAAAIPGLDVAGIDLMVQNLEDAEGAIVLEANTAANIAVHHYPGFGNEQPVAEAILDLLEKRSRERIGSSTPPK